MLNTYVIIFIAYIMWITLGWIFGIHWIVLIAITKNKERYFSIIMFLLYLGSAGLLSLGSWCRNSGRYVKCPDGEEMSRLCLWNSQNADYIIIYILHYIGLAFLFSAWLLDCVQLYSWIFQIYNTNQKEGQILSMKLFNSNSRFIASWSYMKILLYCVFNITIMWTLIVPWNTHPTIGKTIGLGALFWILVAVIILTASIVQYYYIYTDTRKKNDDGSHVNDEKDDNTNNKIIAYISAEKIIDDI